MQIPFWTSYINVLSVQTHCPRIAVGVREKPGRRLAIHIKSSNLSLFLSVQYHLQLLSCPEMHAFLVAASFYLRYTTLPHPVRIIIYPCVCGYIVLFYHLTIIGDIIINEGITMVTKHKITACSHWITHLL